MNQQLTNFYDHLNTSVITTNDFAEGTLYRKREKVNQFAYCGLNPVYRKYLSFDLDYPDAGHKFEELKVPPPTIITTNRANGHAHYLYELITPVAYHQLARQKPQEYFERPSGYQAVSAWRTLTNEKDKTAITGQFYAVDCAHNLSPMLLGRNLAYRLRVSNSR